MNPKKIALPVLTVLLLMEAVAAFAAVASGQWVTFLAVQPISLFVALVVGTWCRMLIQDAESAVRPEARIEPERPAPSPTRLDFPVHAHAHA